MNNANLMARLERAESLTAIASGCSACVALPAARAVLVDGETHTSLLGDSDPWGATDGACARCGRRPDWSLTCYVVQSLAEAAALPQSTPADRHMALTAQQAQFIRCDDKTALWCAGLATGKSVAAGLWLLLRLVRYPHGRHYCVGTNTPMLRAGTHYTLRGLLDDCGWSYTYNRTTLAITIESGPARGAEVTFWSSESFAGTKGLEADSLLCEELSEWEAAEAAYTYVLGRLRQSPPARRYHPDLEPRLRTVCNPPSSLAHFVYTRFIEPPENEEDAKGRPTVFFGRTLDNVLLPDADKYVSMLRATMSPSVFKSQVLGEFIEIGQSRIYEQFSHATHVKKDVPGLPPIAYDPRLPLVVGLDFGPRMGAAALMQVHRLAAPVAGYQRVLVYVVDEIAMENSYTQALMDAFEARYPSTVVADGILTKRQVQFYGDATGERATSGGMGESDWEIVRRFMTSRGYYGQIKKDNTNPLKIDRTAVFNYMLRDTNGDVGILIAPHCRVMIRDMATVRWKDGPAKIIDHGKSGALILSHMSDAAGYFIAYEFNPAGFVPRIHPAGSSPFRKL